MRYKFLLLVIVMIKSKNVDCQNKNEDTSIFLNITAIDAAAIKENILSSIKFGVSSDSIIITNFVTDTFRLRYHFPFVYFNKELFLKFMSIVNGKTDSYFFLLNLTISDTKYTVKIPYYNLWKENSLLIDMRKKKKWYLDCYYFMVHEKEGVSSITRICRGVIVEQQCLACD